MRLRRVVPEPPTHVTVAEAYDTTDRNAPDGRPWVMATMVASVDGTTSIDGRSGPLGNRTDSAVLAATRAAADVVVVGANTVRSERYGPPRRSDLRIGVVTRTGDLDLATDLFQSGAGFLIAPEDAPALPVPNVRAGSGTVDLPLALARLGDVLGAEPEVVQCEGGPSLNAELARAGCLDELNLTLSPRIAGGRGSRIVEGADTVHLDLRLTALLVDDDGFLFSRWQRR